VVFTIRTHLNPILDAIPTPETTRLVLQTLELLPADLVAYRVDTEDFGSLLLRFGKAGHGFADHVHANASVSQVAAGWMCSLYVGIYGTKGSVQWSLQQPNEIILGRRDEPNQILQRGTAGFSADAFSAVDASAAAATSRARARAT
jgi:predicted dehydrogenase